jgi:hypothetical protein
LGTIDGLGNDHKGMWKELVTSSIQQKILWGN